MIKPRTIFKYWRADDVAECMEGVSDTDLTLHSGGISSRFKARMIFVRHVNPDLKRSLITGTCSLNPIKRY